MSETFACPFACGYETKGEYEIHLHVEYQHAEGASPFLVQEDGSQGPVQAQAARSAESVQYAECPIEECGEVITLAEFDDHLELHNLEKTEATSASPDSANGYVSPYADLGHYPPSSHGARDGNPDHDKQAASIERWKHLLHMPSAPHKEHKMAEPPPTEKQRKRLGKAELGKYAHEDRMPDWLVDLLKREGQVAEHGVIEVLRQLLDASSTTTWAYLCHPSTQHISKLKREGGFCGYRNIQMLSSYIIGARAQGHEHFHRRIPSIFKIQDFIERAWDMGINARGRIETGGVKGSRKYIGTPEAQAMFLSLDIPVRAMGFRDSQTGQAEARLMQHVLEYFEAAHIEGSGKVRRTSLPPIYFQHRGHSLTIVGIEKRSDGALELLVFDPMFRDPPAISGMVGRVLKNKTPVDKSLKLYRRGNKYLKKYHEFEVLELVPLASRTSVPVTEEGSSSVARHAHH